MTTKHKHIHKLYVTYYILKAIRLDQFNFYTLCRLTLQIINKYRGVRKRKTNCFGYTTFKQSFGFPLQGRHKNDIYTPKIEQ